MLFNSSAFLIFCLIAFGIYYSPLARSRQVELLIAASLLFYAWAQPWFLLVLALSIIINSITASQIVRAGGRKVRAL